MSEAVRIQEMSIQMQRNISAWNMTSWIIDQRSKFIYILAIIVRNSASLDILQVGRKLIPTSQETHVLYKHFGILVQVIILDLQLLNDIFWSSLSSKLKLNSVQVRKTFEGAKIYHHSLLISVVDGRISSTSRSSRLSPGK